MFLSNFYPPGVTLVILLLDSGFVKFCLNFPGSSCVKNYMYIFRKLLFEGGGGVSPLSCNLFKYK